MEELKHYTRTEELANSFMHFLGALFAVYAIFTLISTATTSLQKVSTAIYGTTLLILFLSSTFYHAIKSQKVKKIFRKIDHSAIYLVIAGTYTPILMMIFNFPLSIELISMIWVLAIIGIVFSCTTLKSGYLSTGIYLFMGWLSVFFAYSIWIKYPHYIIWLLLGGGIFFTLGCIFYLSKKKFMHTIWHLFVLIGLITHYFCILELLKI